MIDLLRKRRSIRKYTHQPIDQTVKDIILETLLRSPSSMNKKPAEFVIVEDRELLQKLSNAKPHGAQFLQHAAMGIVICADSTKSDVWIEDASIASILSQMTALSSGLGSCWIQIRNRTHSETETSEEYIQKLLGLPEHIKVLSMISIGHPDETKNPVAATELDYRRIRHNQYAKQYVPSQQK